MASEIFEALLIEQINLFKNSFSTLSEQLFYDPESKKLRHAGEFGVYREIICRNFLRFFIPKNLKINTGFVINYNNKVSTQCDIVIYDPDITPLLQAGELQRFFPIESIASIGEVKSTMSKEQLKIALNKLARIKMFRKDLIKATVIKRRKSHMSFNPERYPIDQVYSFLICHKLDFDISNICNEISALYDEDIEHVYKHNIVLSIEDGVLIYNDHKHNNLNALYPNFDGVDFKNKLIARGDSGYAHFKIFAHFMFLGVTYTTLLFPEMLNYMTDDQNVKTYIER